MQSAVAGQALGTAGHALPRSSGGANTAEFAERDITPEIGIVN